MKRIFILLFILSAFLITSRASNSSLITINGYVFNNTNSNVIANHTVWIESDSSYSNPGYFYYSQLTTNAYGFFCDTILVQNISNVVFLIKTLDCNNVFHQIHAPFNLDSGNTNSTFYFRICDNPAINCQANFYTSDFNFNDSIQQTYTKWFYDASIGNITNWFWNFGDSSFSNLQNPVHQYSNAGIYNVCLTVSGDSCTSTYCSYVYIDSVINNLCNASFYGYNDTTNNGYQFINTSLDSIINPTNVMWLWDFGDGSYSQDFSPFHTYNQAGYYDVCLQETIYSTGVVTCVSNYCSTIYFGGQQPDCQASFNFIQVPDSITVPPINMYSFAFWSTSSGNPTRWMWDFGDNTYSIDPCTRHTYSQPGLYNVCLTIYTASGCSSSYCATIFAGDSINQNCNADFRYTNLNSNPQTYMFTSISSGNISDWQWDFGDGSYSNLPNPSHTYINPGTYFVCLSVYNYNPGQYCFDTKCTTINVVNPSFCQANFYVKPDPGDFNAPSPTKKFFYDMSNGTPDSWLWSFGDSTFSTEQNPIHDFPSFGIYNVCLTITNDSCTSTFCLPVIIDSIIIPISYCQADFYAYLDSTVNCLNCYQFVDRSIGFPNKWFWDFGDGQTSTLRNPLHHYLNSGTYNICLTISYDSIYGTDTLLYCYSTDCQNINVGGTVTPNSITGRIFAGTNSIDYGFVALMKKEQNIYIPVDVKIVNSSSFYSFNNLQNGTYIVAAATSPTSIYYPNYLPTFYGDVVNWENATPIIIGSSVYPAIMYDIHLVNISGINHNGIGVIGGTVTSGNSNLQSNGTPLENIQVMLLDANNNPVAYVYTNNLGKFNFNSLSLGTYKVYAQVLGKNTIPATITLNNSTSSITNLSIVVNSTTVAPSGVNDLEKELSITGNIYPNPATDKININISITKTQKIAFVIFNSLGQEVINFTNEYSAGNQTVEIPISKLNKGIYNLHISTENNDHLSKKFAVIN